MDDYFPPTRSEPTGAVRYLQTLRSRWRLILLIAALSTAAAALFVNVSEKRFEAAADVALSPIPANDDTFQGFSLFRQSLDGSSSVVTAARVFNSAQTRGPASVALDREGIEATLAATPVTQADIVSMQATASSGEAAAEAANLFAQTAVATRTAVFQKELLDHIGRLQRRVDAIPVAQRDTNPEYAALAGRLGELRGFVGARDPTVRVAVRATTPGSASWPRPTLTIGAALIASLLVGVGLALLLEVMNPRVSREDELTATYGLPILARIPKLSASAASDYLSGRRPLPGGAWKGYRTLRASLATAGHDGVFPRSILVTSASPNDGKSMTAVNLAITLAIADIRVVLVDADLHRPRIASIFNIAAPPGGLATVLEGRSPLGSALVDAPAHPNLRLLLTRPEVGAQMRLFDAARIKRAVEELQREVDVVIFDSPPITEVAETLELAAAVETVVIAVRLGNTRRDRLSDLRLLLARRGVSPAGIVLTTDEVSATESQYGYKGDVPPASPPRGASTRRVVRVGDR